MTGKSEKNGCTGNGCRGSVVDVGARSALRALLERQRRSKLADVKAIDETLQALASDEATAERHGKISVL